MTPPSERIWICYHFDEGPEGLEPNPGRVQTFFAELAVIQSRIGGTMTLATRRKEVAPGRVETMATICRWRSFVPIEKAQEAPPAEQEAGHPATPPPVGAEEILTVPDDQIEEPTPIPESPPAPPEN